MADEVQNLVHRTINNVPILYKLDPTLLDGKGRVLWAGKTAMCNCLNCGATPKQMSKRHQNRPVDVSTFKFGMSPLHLRVRTMEWCCKAKLYQDMETWSIPAEWKFLKDARMVEMQTAAKDLLGLDLYKVLPGCVGNSNTGNTSRRAFQNPEKFAKILDGDETIVQIIRNLAKVLNAINSKSEIDPDKLEALCQTTLDLIYESKWSWNWLSHSVHVLLHHSPQIVRYLPTPPGNSFVYLYYLSCVFYSPVIKHNYP